MKFDNIKRIFFVLFVSTLFSFLFVACPYSHRNVPYDGMVAYGLVYLTVSAPDGETAIKDTDSDRFIIQYSGRESYIKDKIVINVEDKLIYILGKIKIYRKDADSITDEDIKNALNSEDLGFALKDTKNEYKTVVTTYKACYKGHRKYNLYQGSTMHHGDGIDYIYNCEIKLEKK